MTYSDDWLLLLARVFSDEVPPHKPDAAYLVGETRDNAASVLVRGAKLWKSGVVPKIAVQANGEGYGYCGYEYSRRWLLKEGVSFPVIEPMFIGSEYIEAKCVNTLSEMISVVRLAKEKLWKSIYIIASPLHQLRSFFTVVTALDHEYPELKVYNCLGLPLFWNEIVVHSQGVLTGSRIDLFLKELKQIQVYQTAPPPHPLLMPLVSIERVFQYLDQRDAD